LSIQKENSGSFNDAALRGRPVETGLQGDENVQAIRKTSLACSLGLGRADLTTLVAEIEASEVRPSKIISRVGRRYFHHLDGYLWLTPEDDPILLAASLFQEAIATAKTIARIAESAATKTIPIRWFDFGLFEMGEKASGGIAGFLQPMSAVELRAPPPKLSVEQVFFCLGPSQQMLSPWCFDGLKARKSQA
jgi:hypothetical protein